MSAFHCKICGLDHASIPEWTTVRSNVRAFKQERFRVWRCAGCKSLHAADEVDLDHYYSKYPFFGKTLDLTMRLGYRRLTRRLRRAGLKKNDRVLDFGCGSGLLTQYLRQQGYDASGYDPFTDLFNEPGLLDKKYDGLLAQDVLEHDPNPLDLLRRFGKYVKPGGLVFIGTPNASGIDLTRPEKFVHPLHQPYHRHIFAIEALLQAAADRGWELVKYYPAPYTNIPVLSLPFLHHYMRCFDGTLDSLFDKSAKSLRLCLSPETLYYLIAGYFLCDDADIVAIFKTPTEG